MGRLYESTPTAYQRRLAQTEPESQVRNLSQSFAWMTKRVVAGVVPLLSVGVNVTPASTTNVKVLMSVPEIATGLLKLYESQPAHPGGAGQVNSISPACVLVGAIVPGQVPTT